MSVDGSLASNMSMSDIDTQFLSLFPTLAVKKPSDLKKLACLYAFGLAQKPLSAKDVSRMSKITPSAARKILGTLVSLSLLTEEKIGKEKSTYGLTSKGIIALMSVTPFQSFSRIKPLLALQRNDDLAFAMLAIGHSPPFPSFSFSSSSSSERKDDSTNVGNGNGNGSLLYTALSGYAKYGYNIESVDSSVLADSILQYFSKLARGNSKSVQPYLNMFRDFTPAGFQDILRMLVVAVKPTPDDYNWLIQFFYQLVEFYYNPIRMTYAHMLASGDPVLRSRLENYKREQEVMMKNESGSVELTFKVVGGFEFEKFARMPPHLKAMGFKLVLEPLRFMNEELKFAFWSDRTSTNKII